MSRTTLCVLTAALLVTLSLSLMAGRYQVLGDEALMPRGPRTWKVTMKVSGRTSSAKARLMTLTPLDGELQHVRKESFHSDELLAKPPTARHPERRHVLWTPRAGAAEGHFSAIYEFYCQVSDRHAARSASQLSRELYAPPQPGDCLESEPLIESDHAEITALARQLGSGHAGDYDVLQAIYRHVDQHIANEPSTAGSAVSAVACLRKGSGDTRAKSRLLVALCRNRGIPARALTGLTLTKGHKQTAHAWVETYVRKHWMALCPFYHHFGKVPSTYLVFGIGDLFVARGRYVADLDHAFLVEHTAPDEDGLDAEACAAPPADDPVAGTPEPAATPKALTLHHLAQQLSLDSLPGPERRLVEFLLLLPIAALIVCIFRNVIGIQSFGTFAPALVGLAFRDIASWPGILVFVSIVLLGWVMRRGLDRYHLLQVPRTSVMLSLVVILLILAVVAANYRDLEATKYIPLFPIVILTGMIERFWTLETEDGTSSSFRTLLSTMFIAACIAVCLSWSAVANHMFRFPETLGLIMALQLLIGRYTGYRLSELFRFQDFVQTADA